MTIQQCKYALVIAKTGSFNEASKQLFIAQSTLSLSIKGLENELGIKIFERLKNGVCLTEEGVEFIVYAGRIVEENELIRQRYSSTKNYERLTVATQHYDFIADIFGKMINQTGDDYYRFALRETKTYDVIHELETGYSNIGIIAIKDSDYEIMKRFLTSKGLTFTPFIKAFPHVFLSKNHKLAKREKLSLTDLREYPYVMYEQGQHNISLFTEELIDKPIANKYIEISDRATLMNMLLITNSYTIGTGIMPSALNKGDIVSIPLDSDECYVIGYILNCEKKITPLTKKFINLIEKSTQNI